MHVSSVEPVNRSQTTCLELNRTDPAGGPIAAPCTGIGPRPNPSWNQPVTRTQKCVTAPSFALVAFVFFFQRAARRDDRQRSPPSTCGPCVGGQPKREARRGGRPCPWFGSRHWTLSIDRVAIDQPLAAGR